MWWNKKKPTLAERYAAGEAGINMVKLRRELDMDGRVKCVSCRALLDESDAWEVKVETEYHDRYGDDRTKEQPSEFYCKQDRPNYGRKVTTSYEHFSYPTAINVYRWVPPVGGHWDRIVDAEIIQPGRGNQ